VRCKACNIELTDYEATIRCSNTDEFIDICSSCLSAGGDVNFSDRADLRTLADMPEFSSLFDELDEYYNE